MNTPDEFGCQVARREFISKLAAAGTSLCFANSCLFSQLQAQDKQDEKPFEENYDKVSELTYTQVFNFAYKDLLIPQLVALSKLIGREKLVELLTKASDEAWFNSEVQKNFSATVNRTFEKNISDSKRIEKTETKRVYEVHHCLWAKVFRETNAEDFGYAMFCSGSNGIARSKDEQYIMPKCLMSGDDLCHFEFIKKT